MSAKSESASRDRSTARTPRLKKSGSRFSSDVEGEIRRVLRAATSTLADLEIPYDVTRELASSYYGEPRLTQDIDLAVRLSAESVVHLAGRLGTDFLVPLSNVEDAVRRRGCFKRSIASS